MSEVKIRVFNDVSSHGQLEFNMNNFLEQEAVSYIGHTVSVNRTSTKTGAYSSVGIDTQSYAGSIAYRNKNKGHHHG